MASRALLTKLGELGKRVNYYADPLFWNRKLGYKNALRVAETWSLINEYTPLSIIQSFRIQRLNKLVSHAYNYVPFYSELYRLHDIDPTNSFGEEDFRKLPIVKKKDLKIFLNSKSFKNIPSWRKRETITSGSSGEPFRFFLDNAHTVEMIAM